MFNIAFSVLDAPPEPEKKAWINFELGGLWKNGKLTTVTTVYLGTLIVLVIFTMLLILFGKNQEFMKPALLNVIWYIMIGTLPFIFLYEMFMGYVNRTRPSAADTSKGTQKNRRRRG
ncbi:hypothetical protein MMB75_25640 [Paenibacillus sp. P2(2022)]|uniref:hypothetical protein n=1 Tax=Paenibacillus sp. P2(2022) TaxID=2917813 RepID=UPI0024058D4E|nr:hypothetical protein [Paenibacillus sp. P2(2022)]MDG0057013.1 hypothetical protein [Paenibacillus sp. P2(2022)]